MKRRAGEDEAAPAAFRRMMGSSRCSRPAQTRLVVRYATRCGEACVDPAREILNNRDQSPCRADERRRSRYMLRPLLSVAFMLALAQSGGAQTYPSKPIRLI